MHLLAAQPGGFVDDEGIIDLDQTPGDIIILSAADTSLAALSEGARRFYQQLYRDVSLSDTGDSVEKVEQEVKAGEKQKPTPAIRLANWMQLLKPAAYDLYEHKVLEQAELVVLSLLGGQNYWAYGFERLVEWSKGQTTSGRARQLIIVPGDDTPDPELFTASTQDLNTCQKVWRYLRQSGIENSENLLRFLTQEVLLGNGWTPGFCLQSEKTSFDQKQTIYLQQWQEPRVLPNAMRYFPAVGKEGSKSEPQDSELFQSSEPFQNSGLLQGSGLSQKTSLLLFYRSHLQSANTDVFDGLMSALQAQGLNPVAVAIASLKDDESVALVNHLAEQHDARLIINTTGFASNRVDSPDLSSEPTEFASPFERQIPVLQLVLSGSTEQDWQQHSQGLRSRDIAMQVVLPEMDGRVITRAVSFKAESWFDPRCQVSVVRYQLHQERANFIAELAQRYCQLSNKANVDKRLAIILANYPTKDGRIGNGVGLDTPQSAVNILQALKASGYPLDQLPESGTELIEWLLESVTNNPNTLHQLPCWQSMALDEYRHHFNQIPLECQQAVLESWGAPEQDIKCRDGRLMLSGLRLGEVFVGIQPARGFNIDLAANYHDPDLIPPHNYLAFYFWLRHCYQVEAVVHVGKHGNLEWLPGKGTALSDQCWPDIALGPVPHFYPFIVNDPGEGAQAKRRTQAVIIDHLMPPMTRAESYGEMAELESLVDEYYQAMGMDERREKWLRDEIMQQVRKTHLLEELGKATAESSDDEVLAELDAYLCEIKESQIRHGLHILGQLPNTDKLAATLVALLRLPRGADAESQGILHNLSKDLDLRTTSGELFDPLAADTQPWQGKRPECLQTVDQNTNWRTAADTRERLELLALQLVKVFLLKDSVLREQASMSDGASLIQPTSLNVEQGFGAELAECLPRTARQLKYARARLLPALKQSAEQELSALTNGLEGQFVPPGPSGAPTRGRLDTLPTGRNFFSVDNRSIPSPAAWAIGERSAQALIERHLQEHGDFPKQLGLSVWGTATMRTGGDDIAQAFALMGVRPIWAPGSNRVTDFEVISCMRLGRPRVDVTLRVSGFFRDAFPNVMKLYDAAVQKIAALEEPGNGNTIKANILSRQQALIEQGLSPEQAMRQASYRVFGSKPGAYGAGLQGLIDERCWEESSDLAEAYLNWGGYAYGNQAGDGVAAHQAFQHRLSQLEVVVQNQDNREHDLLDSDDYYQFQGGMNNAVRVFRGEAPEVYHSDHSNPSAPKIRTLKEELNRVIRSRVLNPKWINAMREHGYKGAFEMAASVDYLFAYDATTDLIDDYQYEKVADALVFDRENQDFLQQHNPHALEEMAERLLEATQRGLWQEPGEYARRLQHLLLELDEQNERADSLA